MAWTYLLLAGIFEIGIVFYGEPGHGLRIGFLAMLMVALVGLRLTGA